MSEPLSRSSELGTHAAGVRSLALMLRLTLPLFCLILPFWFTPWDVNGAGFTLASTFTKVGYLVGTMLLLRRAWLERDFLNGWMYGVDLFMACLVGLPGLAMSCWMTAVFREPARGAWLAWAIPVALVLAGWLGAPPEELWLVVAVAWWSLWGLTLMLQIRQFRRGN